MKIAMKGPLVSLKIKVLLRAVSCSGLQPGDAECGLMFQGMKERVPGEMQQSIEPHGRDVTGATAISRTY
jgi:hypothetical protein